MTRHPSVLELVAVDIGNSWIKLGRFDRNDQSPPTTLGGPGSRAALPEPTLTLELPLANRSGDFDSQRLSAWCLENVKVEATWLVSSVHRGAAKRLAHIVSNFKSLASTESPYHALTYRDVPLALEVDLPERVGIDRLLGALAANELRKPNEAAIVVDLGTAIKVDLVTPSGAFAGGAIMPGLSMSARALEEQTDALPHVAVEKWHLPPLSLGKSTVPAIEAGLFWGAVGAVRELIRHFSSGLNTPPQVFVTGGNSALMAEPLRANCPSPVLHIPHLVLSGIALAHAARASKS
jgi:type III pantothenate kinase